MSFYLRSCIQADTDNNQQCRSSEEEGRGREQVEHQRDGFAHDTQFGVVRETYIREIKRRLQVPIIVDAGVGTASDACVTMEQGVDGVLMNTAIAAADDPVAMGEAMRLAIQAGRLAYLAGRMPSREIAVPSSPVAGMLD